MESWMIAAAVALYLMGIINGMTIANKIHEDMKIKK